MNKEYRIVQADNYDNDYYYEECFVTNLPLFYHREKAQAVCDAINNTISEEFPRYWKVVEMPYTLRQNRSREEQLNY